jgi:hypothetical protein
VTAVLQHDNVLETRSDCRSATRRHPKKPPPFSPDPPSAVGGCGPCCTFASKSTAQPRSSFKKQILNLLNGTNPLTPSAYAALGGTWRGLWKSQQRFVFIKKTSEKVIVHSHYATFPNLYI